MSWLSSDRERLKQFRNGNKEVFANVYTVYKSDLAHSLVNGFSIEDRGKLILIAVRRGFELDDILQETFLKAFGEKSRLSYDGIRPFSAWLKTIARNLVIDRYRILSRYSYDEVYEAVEVKMNQGIGESQHVSPEEALLRREQSRIYARFIAGLNADDRLLVKMRFEEQLTREDVIERTGQSVMQIRYREKKLFLNFKKFFDGGADKQTPPLDRFSGKRKEKKR